VEDERGDWLMVDGCWVLMKENGMGVWVGM